MQYLVHIQLMSYLDISNVSIRYCFDKVKTKCNYLKKVYISNFPQWTIFYVLLMAQFVTVFCRLFSRFGSFHSLKIAVFGAYTTLPHFMIGRALFLASVKACIQFYHSNYFRSWQARDGKCKTQQKLSKVCNPYHTVRTTYREFIKTNLLYIGKSISFVSSSKTSYL